MPPAISPELAAAYRATRYTVAALGLVLRIGQRHPDLDALLTRRQFDGWAFVAAANPYSGALCEQENRARHQNLLEALATGQHVFFEGMGEPVGSDWQPELSVLILGISRDDALALARYFEQNALVYGRVGDMAELVWAIG
ncbi:hypothetical protein IGB42_03839 [Andreprevotia sp. IGB-42]|uniref:DUF3293 domain-containing protein n=1 Tax=Andreprevotia sp. IGB-42 TaxID=2497473 RepID=UPI00135B96AC|nr:DUF3293 domain-containing protein [Andreprevotia sp. IGB-42]KAF0811681.1 hypothetical protein IGB42_03839 [Andreprevotia sp. IGB-42]